MRGGEGGYSIGPYGVQRHNEQLHLSACTFNGLATCWASRWEGWHGGVHQSCLKRLIYITAWGPGYQLECSTTRAWQKYFNSP